MAHRTAQIEDAPGLEIGEEALDMAGQRMAAPVILPPAVQIAQIGRGEAVIERACAEIGLRGVGDIAARHAVMIDRADIARHDQIGVQPQRTLGLGGLLRHLFGQFVILPVNRAIQRLPDAVLIEKR